MTDYVTPEHIFFLFCLVKNKHPNITLQEARTIFSLKYGRQTGEVSRVMTDGGDRALVFEIGGNVA